MAIDVLPFGLPAELSEIIFDYLTADELLNSMLVSSLWHDFILGSRCFGKVSLSIHKESDVGLVVKSSRRYINLRLLKLSHGKFYNCISTLGPSAKKVIIVGCCATVSVDAFNLPIKHVTLPYMEELTLSDISSEVWKTLMTFHRKLKVLNVHRLNLKGGDEDVIEFLRLNGNLGEINFYLNETCNVFQQDISNMFRFNLTSTTINFPSNIEIDSRTLANIENFLVSQGKTLKTVGLVNAASMSSLYRVWNQLRSLEHLQFFSADPFFDLESIRPQIEMNRNLKSLELHDLGPLQLDLNDFKQLLKATINLRSLGVWRLSKDLIEYSAMSLRSLDTINCAIIEDGCESFYDQLKSKNGINKAIKLHRYL